MISHYYSLCLLCILFHDPLFARKCIGATEEQQEEVLHIMYDAAASVLSVDRICGSAKVAKKTGKLGSYGLQPLQVVHQQEGPNAASLTYSTLQGGHFDGQIYIRAKKVKDKLVIQVRLLIQKKGSQGTNT